MLSGLYVEGDSWLHRVRPGVKLVGLLVFTTCLLVWSGVVAVVVVAGCVGFALVGGGFGGGASCG
ncbi:hypothetical protein [Dermatophilus congolensis]|uniref:hypothetical protein n=1 Tax=Dermatophilus congolensis TaxID=1863 RepID=UPI001AB05D69|nr:hypothetical protein [Dermatophilus congolensis]MBO3153978.1 hypothetical protein [Dermatophilus congolensis]